MQKLSTHTPARVCPPAGMQNMQDSGEYAERNLSKAEEGMTLKAGPSLAYIPSGFASTLSESRVVALKSSYCVQPTNKHQDELGFLRNIDYVSLQWSAYL